MKGTTLVDLATVGPARTPALRHLSRIIQAATVRPAGAVACTAVRCRRRPGHRPCGGFIEVCRQDLPELVRWYCPRCGDGGVARNWRQSAWRLRAAPWAGKALMITVPEATYRLLEFNAPLDEQAQRVVRGALVTDGVIQLDGGTETLRRLHNHLCTLGRRGPDERLRRRAEAAARDFADGFRRSATERGAPRRG